MIKIRLELIFLAVLGTLLAYALVDSFIIPISFAKFFLIEVTITVMHALYSHRRKSVIKKA